MSKFVKGTGLATVPGAKIQVIATETFKAALGGVEVVTFKKGEVFGQAVSRAEVEIWLKRGWLKEHKPGAKPAAAAANSLPSDKDLAEMNKETLLKQADAEKVAVDGRSNKETIIKAILEARGA